MSLEQAIAQLEFELSGNAPKEGSADWYLARGRALGLSFLRTMQAAGLVDVPAVERNYRTARRAMKLREDE